MCELVPERRASSGSTLAYSQEVLRFVTRMVSGWLVLALVCAHAAGAQDQPPAEHHHEMPAATAAAWTWTADANAFFGYNYQQRHFADFSAWESQNWAMLSGERTVGAGRFTVRGMFSLEPFTLHKQGSPQLFQTGESYQNVPLVNYQHPHDLLMALGATYKLPRGRVTYLFGADLVGSPALGPMAFMHRESARDNPQVPLTHHFVDSTHITPGVLTAGAQIGQVTLESSVFRGAEPDENRTNLERPRLDSWSARATWRYGPWEAQFSGGRLHEPEWFEAYDTARLSASLGFNGQVWSRPLVATFIWGENREDTGLNGTADGYLAEWDLRATNRSTIYGRAEVANKEIFGIGGHPKGSPFAHRHNYFLVEALTTGYIRDVLLPGVGRLGVGADLTLYHMPPGLLEYYASSHSFHVFLRWRPSVAVPHVH
jgi:hypothetical protein